MKEGIKNISNDATSGDPEKMGKSLGKVAEFVANTIAFSNTVTGEIKAGSAAENSFETLYRVQGGGSKVRMVVDANKVTIIGEDMLFVNIGQEGRALEFLAKRGDDAILIKVKIDSKFVEKIKKDAVPQRLGRQNPGKPQIVDPTKAVDQFGIPKEYFPELVKSVDPKSVQVLTKK